MMKVLKFTGKFYLKLFKDQGHGNKLETFGMRNSTTDFVFSSKNAQTMLIDDVLDKSSHLGEEEDKRTENVGKDRTQKKEIKNKSAIKNNFPEIKESLSRIVLFLYVGFQVVIALSILIVMGLLVARNETSITSYKNGLNLISNIFSISNNFSDTTYLLSLTMAAYNSQTVNSLVTTALHLEILTAENILITPVIQDVNLALIDMLNAGHLTN